VVTVKPHRKEEFKIRKIIRKFDPTTGKFVIDIRYKVKTDITPRTIGVAEAFGIGVDEHKEHVIYDNAEFKIGPRDIVYITGESGSGKSVLLKALEKDLGKEAINIDQVKVDPEKPIVETVGGNLDEALELLSRVGLNDAYLFVRRYSQLSDGQRYRYRIAKLLESEGQYWVMDEFCAALDRETAKIVAFNVQKQAQRAGKAVIAATTHIDMFEDLAPTVHIHKGWGKRLDTKYYPDNAITECTVTKDLTITEGTLEDYKKLAEFHYRNPKAHAAVRKVFVMKTKNDETVGVIMYSYPPLATFGRRKALGRQPSIGELNRDFSIISRVILHPKYRSTGLGTRLVRETLPLVGTPYVETVAVMARYNPFFEKGGMTKITEARGDATVQEAISKLEFLGFKLYALASQETNLTRLVQLNNLDIQKVKDALLEVSQGYYKRLKASGKAYTNKTEYVKFISEASKETLAKVISRLAILAQTKVYLLWCKS
jgi:ABC-type lipoprotein export system ATPase subunit/GNAT superfamily N-acetyltransferase